jgi:hypothetical protein
MQKLKLTNSKKVQVVSLKLDKNKPRELAFRIFLDQNEINGINRKETILRMFEQIVKQSNNIFADNYAYVKNDIEENPNTKIDTITINQSNTNIDDWDAI